MHAVFLPDTRDVTFTVMLVCAGQLSHVLGSKTTALGLIMGSPEAWQTAQGAGLPPQGSGLRQNALDSKATAKSPSTVLYDSLQQKLRCSVYDLSLHACML